MKVTADTSDRSIIAKKMAILDVNDRLYSL
jgi:hypothetical protein